MGNPEATEEELNQAIESAHLQEMIEELPDGIIVTTEKDAVKMKDFTRNDIFALKLKTSVDVNELLN